MDSKNTIYYKNQIMIENSCFIIKLGCFQLKELLKKDKK